jgi:putative ABC transport system permease protein
MSTPTVPTPTSYPVLPPLPGAGSLSWTGTLAQASREGLRSIAAFKLRSALTILGLVVAIGGVMVIDSFGKVLTLEMGGIFAAAGANLVSIQSVAPNVNGVQVGADSTLTEQDAQTVSKLPHVRAISVSLSPHMNAKSQVVAGNQNWSTPVLGVFPDIRTVQGATMAQGSFFTAQDEISGATVAVLGATVARNLFPNGGAVGQQVRITAPPPVPMQHADNPNAPTATSAAVLFTVAGVMQPQGAGLLGNDPDDVIYIPFSTAQQRLLGRGTGTFGNMFVQVDQQQNVAGVMTAATRALEQNHRRAAGQPDDFQVSNFAAAANRGAAQMNSIRLVLAGITALALIIGGFGVANVMFASVARRRREIGVRMAVGAERRHVLAQFVLEACVLSLLGGLIGIVLGYGLVFVLLHTIPIFRSVGPLTPLLPGMASVVIAVGLAIGSGLIFGYLPARRASRLDPVQALRQG